MIEAAERLRPVREPPVGKAADSPVLRPKEQSKYNHHQPASPVRERSWVKSNNTKNSQEASQETRHYTSNINNKKLTDGDVKSNKSQPPRNLIPKDEILAKARNRANQKLTDNRGRIVAEERVRGEGSTGKESTPDPPRKSAHRGMSTEKHWNPM